MQKRITLNTFRRLTAAEEIMIRATMPRTSAADIVPLAHRSVASPAEIIARRQASRLVRPVPVLTVTIAEVARA